MKIIGNIDAFDTQTGVWAAVIVAVTIIIDIIANIRARRTYRNQIYQEFTTLWYKLDEIFIQNPEYRKYFYTEYRKDGENPVIPSECRDKCIAIAELFRDIFEYSEPLATEIETKYAYSYYMYTREILNSVAFHEIELKNNTDVFGKGEGWTIYEHLKKNKRFMNELKKKNKTLKPPSEQSKDSPGQ